MQLVNALSCPAKSLRFERAPIKLPAPLDNKMGHMLLSVLGFYSHKSQLLHGEEEGLGCLGASAGLGASTDIRATCCKV